MKKLIILFLVFVISITVFAQHEDEVSSSVPELMEFHDVIYPMWHTAWPAKDTEMLVSLLPDVESGVVKIKNAELPGILRDKKAKWNGGVDKLLSIAEDYKTAAGKKDMQALLNAAEQLHKQFEALVRIIRPVIKELDAFHQELYMIYHYYMPEKQFDKIKNSMAVLAERMINLEKAELPKSLESKKDNFYLSLKELKEAVDNLVMVVENEKTEEVEPAVEKMHGKYQKLEALFD